MLRVSELLRKYAEHFYPEPGQAPRKPTERKVRMDQHIHYHLPEDGSGATLLISADGCQRLDIHPSNQSAREREAPQWAADINQDLRRVLHRMELNMAIATQRMETAIASLKATDQKMLAALTELRTGNGELKKKLEDLAKEVDDSEAQAKLEALAQEVEDQNSAIEKALTDNPQVPNPEPLPEPGTENPGGATGGANFRSGR